jgi:hypothetical protein
MNTHVIEFVAKENLDKFVAHTKIEKMKSQLAELDFKHATGQRVPRLMADEERLMNERIDSRELREWESIREHNAELSY